MATPKQDKFIKLILENIGNEKSSKTYGQMLKEAGYSEAIQKNPKLILESEAVKEATSSVVEDLNLLRQKALDELKARDLDKERFPDVVKAIDIYTKNAQLLSGQETERQGVSINVVKYNESNDSV